MLFRKLWRELWSQRNQFTAIFLMSFLGLFAFAGLDSEGSGTEASAKKYYSETNLADVWVQGALFTKSNCQALENLPEIKAVQRFAEVKGELNFYDESKEKQELIICFSDENIISKPQVIEGEAFSAQTEGIWLEENFAKARHLEIGKQLTVSFDELEMTQEIKGFIRAPEYVYYTPNPNELLSDYENFGMAFVAGTCHPMLDEGMEIYNILQIDTYTDGISGKELERLKEKIEIVLESEHLFITERDQNTSYDTLQSEIEEHKSFSFLFAGIFLLIAFLGIITTMVRMTANQRTQIGTLKALGFSDTTIILHYISFGFVVSLLGSISGAAAGYVILPVLLRTSMVQMFLLPQWQVVFTWRSCMAVLAVTALSTMVSYLSCHKELREPPAKALRPRTPKLMKQSFFEKSRFWKNMGFAMQWNFRDIRKNKLRTCMGILGIAGCMMLLVSAFGCMDSIAYMPENIFSSLNLGRYTISFEEGTDAFTVEEYRKKYAGQTIQICPAEFSSRNGSVTILGEGNLIRLQDANGEEIFLQEEDVLISRKMAELLKLTVGDYVEFRILGNDKSESIRITGIYQDASVQGLTLSQKKFEDLEYDFVPQQVVTGFALPIELEEEEEIEGIQSAEKQAEGMLATMDVMFMMVYVIGLAAILLGLVVLYNLAELSFIEKMREYATLKVLGMEEGVIRKIVMYQNLLMGIPGIILGIFAGNVFLKILWSSMSDSMDVITIISLKSYLWAALITLGVIIFSGLGIGGRIRSIPLVEALKGVE